MATTFPDDRLYTSTHEWIKVENGLAVVGITDHAQRELTDLVYVELPQVGRMVRAGEACVVVESVKTAADVYSPVSGRIAEVNSALSTDPGLVNRDPYGGGWLFKVEMTNPAELDQLMDARAYHEHIGG